MPYELITFNGISLPNVRPIDDLATAPTESTLADSLNDAFDYWGTDRRLPRKQIIEMTGIYVGSPAYWVDENDNFIVDENGNNLIFGADYATDIRNQTDDIKKQIGRSGALVRRRADDLTNQNKTARLLNVDHKASLDDVKRVATIKLTFETKDPAWRDSNLTTASASYAAGSNPLTATVGGTEDITDAIIRVAAATNTTSVNITCTGVDFTYSGTITAGNTLVIDTGKLTVKNNGVADYANFTLNAGHTKQAWLYLPNGSTLLTIAITSGTGTISVEFYNQWA